MSKKNLGPTVKEAFGFIESIYADTANLMQIVEGVAQKNKLVGMYGSYSMWDRSYASSGAQGWLSHYIARPYVPIPPQGKKPADLVQDAIGFFIVYFIPEVLTQPVVLYGAYRPGDTVWDFWKYVLAVNNGPTFFTEDKVDEWETHEFPDYETVKKFQYAARPLVEVNNQQVAESLAKAMVKKFRELKKG